MNGNLNTWLGDHPLWLWLLLAVLLATLQLFRRDLLFAALTLAAAVTALLAAIWPDHHNLSLVVFALLASVAVAVARRLERLPPKAGSAP